jgi:hypothetical protein
VQDIDVVAFKQLAPHDLSRGEPTL